MTLRTSPHWNFTQKLDRRSHDYRCRCCFVKESLPGYYLEYFVYTLYIRTYVATHVLTILALNDGVVMGKGYKIRPNNRKKAFHVWLHFISRTSCKGEEDQEKGDSRLIFASVMNGQKSYYCDALGCKLLFMFILITTRLIIEFHQLLFYSLFEFSFAEIGSWVLPFWIYYVQIVQNFQFKPMEHLLIFFCFIWFSDFFISFSVCKTFYHSPNHSRE